MTPANPAVCWTAEDVLARRCDPAELGHPTADAAPEVPPEPPLPDLPPDLPESEVLRFLARQHGAELFARMLALTRSSDDKVALQAAAALLQAGFGRAATAPAVAQSKGPTVINVVSAVPKTSVTDSLPDNMRNEQGTPSVQGGDGDPGAFRGDYQPENPDHPRRGRPPSR